MKVVAIRWKGVIVVIGLEAPLVKFRPVVFY